jgi:dTDP-4-dehydrorhamnose 3,5-epimerase
MLTVTPLALSEVLEITPRRFGDDRGFFSETYNAQRMAEAGIDLVFVQDNHSYSASAGVLRGLHYQLAPRAQDKLVRVVRGAILDVAVDIRRGSPGFGKWVALEVSAEKGNQILVPKGFAHGFVTLVDNTEVIYKVTDFYSPDHERSIRYDDADIGIEWLRAVAPFNLSQKDQAAPLLRGAGIFE